MYVLPALTKNNTRYSSVRRVAALTARCSVHYECDGVRPVSRCWLFSHSTSLDYACLVRLLLVARRLARGQRRDGRTRQTSQPPVATVGLALVGLGARFSRVLLHGYNSNELNHKQTNLIPNHRRVFVDFS